MLDALTTLLQPWADFYSEQTAVATAIIASHVATMFLGGGIAIAADRRVLQAAPRSAGARQAAAADLHREHGLVIGALAMVVASGGLLAAADVGTFATSPVFWFKMATFSGLLINGAVMRRAEQRVLRGADPAMAADVDASLVDRSWRALRRSAWISLAGWFATLLLGVVLGNS